MRTTTVSNRHAAADVRLQWRGRCGALRFFVSSRFEMSGGDREHVAFELTGRKSLPGVSGIVGRMRPAVHPDGPFGSFPRNVRVIRNQLLRLPVHFLPYSKVGGPAPCVVGRVWLALMFRQRQQRCIPGIRAQPRRIVDGQAQIIADLRTGDALRLIFVKPGSPFPRRIKLGKRGQPCRQRLPRATIL